MNFSRDYRRPFWHGFLHALLVAVYVVFLALLLGQAQLMFDSPIGAIVRFAFWIFLSIVSVAVCAGLIFYEPVKKLLHYHFKAATVMLLSTISWLFIFLIIFVLGLVMSLA